MFMGVSDATEMRDKGGSQGNQTSAKLCIIFWNFLRELLLQTGFVSSSTDFSPEFGASPRNLASLSPVTVNRDAQRRTSWR